MYVIQPHLNVLLLLLFVQLADRTLLYRKRDFFLPRRLSFFEARDYRMVFGIQQRHPLFSRCLFCCEKMINEFGLRPLEVYFFSQARTKLMIFTSQL